MDGYICNKENQGSINYGKVINIEHTVSGVKYYSRYGHLSKYGVDEKGKELENGMFVNAGTVIGYVGSTGASSDPHLHFEFMKTYYKWGNTTINPSNIYSQKDTRSNAGSTVKNEKPLFKLVGNTYTFNSDFVWTWNEKAMPEWYSRNSKYYKK
ncbi:MAG: M23 family metallopeptidase [Oscillospiraceae bacterium]|jgi:murein DD-endopeptidase MepM/ murein hydrolase activator NlpD|nr:M23 family metallopeptidase [Oscillospiraceae bacterium]